MEYGAAAAISAKNTGNLPSVSIANHNETAERLEGMTTTEQTKAPTLLRQIGHYLGGQVAVMAAGFISMPILARAFTQAEYGLVNLVSATLLILAAFSKLGLSQATVRFAGRPEAGREREERTLQTSLLLASLASSLVFTVLAIAGGLVFLRLADHHPSTAFLRDNVLAVQFVILGSLLLVPRTITAILMSLMRSEQRSKWNTVFSIVLRYLSLVLGIGGFFAARWIIGHTDLRGYFWGLILAETGVVGYFLAQWWRSHQLRLGLFDTAPLKMAFLYGMPLVAYEVASILVGYVDKYIIQGYHGLEAVALYSAGFGVAELVPVMLTWPIEMAITPHFIRLWEQEGEARTAEFVALASARFAVVVFPVLAIFSDVSGTVLTVLVSTKYSEAAPVIPWVVAGFGMWMGFLPMVASGFYVRKKTSALTMILLAALVLNLALNLVIVPRMGYYGAAITTFVTYLVVLVMAGVGARRYLPVPWHWASLFKTATVAVATAFFIAWLPLGSGLGAAVVRVVVGTVVYAAVMIPLDHHARWIARMVYGKIRGRGNLSVN